ncbi:MAG: TolC family protein [Polyangiaceae bacterium]|nr:TolC family protein [Polyangiaceae bacterium]
MNEARKRLSLLALAVLSTRAPSALAEGAARRLDVSTAVSEALSRNPTRQAAEIGVERARQNVLAEQGRYSYVFQADAGFTHQKSARLGAGDTLSASTTRTYTVGSALRRTFATGTTAELRVQGERFESSGSSLAGSSATGYGVSGRASLGQPLLRGAGTRVGEAELRAARVSKDLADKSNQRTRSALVRDVVLAYWELWYAEESARIQRSALALAKQQERDATARVEQGAAAPTDVLTFATRVAELEESVVTAELGQTQRALDLARLMGSPDPERRLAALSSGPPAAGPRATRADVEAALKSGSLELAELEAQVKLARTRAEVAGESTRARLDLEGYLESQGLSERVPTAARRAGELGYLTAHVGLIYELPLDDSRRNAEKRAALLAVRAAEHDLKAMRDRITAEAALSVTNESAASRRVALAEKTEAVAQKAHAAEKARFELGQSLPIAVQQAEDELRRARLRVARARVDLVQEQTVVLHLAGKLLPKYGG